MKKEEAAPLRVGFISLGCAKNLVDSEVMLGHLDRAGCSFVQDPDEADVLVVNTCAFIESAREESIQAILTAAERKANGKVRRVIVAGCMVQRYRDELASNLPEVDGFVGLDQLHQIVDRVGAKAPPSLPLYVPEKASRYLYDHTTPRRLTTAPWTAYLKIAEGCDHTCSFCAIPSFRGTFRSRDLASIVREAEGLARAGVREINLIAQDSSHYGRDLGLDQGPARLLEALDAVEGIRWVRLHYLYPNTITAGLIAAMAALPSVVKYVDMPLQHAHPKTLLRMRRGGSARSHLDLLARFRDAMPEVALRTTLITGFPGETDEEFEALLAFVDEARFDHLGVFTYSHEEGTSAASLHDDVPEEVKDARRARLLEHQQGISFARNAARVGMRVEVLVEGAHPETDDLLAARMATQAPDVDGAVLINDGIAPPGSFVQVEITEAAGYDVVGRIVGGP